MIDWVFQRFPADYVSLSKYQSFNTLNKLGLSRAELSQARACLEVINLNNFFELSTYHLKVTLSFFGLGSEIFNGLAHQKYI